MKQSEFILRRKNIFNKITSDSVTVLFSGLAPKRSADENYAFEVNRNFLYLTGIEQAHSMLLLIKKGSKEETMLFIDRFDEYKEKWTGKLLTAEEARTLSGIDDVRFSDEFDNDIGKLMAKDTINSVYFDLEKDLKIGENQTTIDYATVFESKTKVEVKNIYPLLMRLRMIKSPEEIACLRAAIHTTCSGLEAIQKNIRGGKYEYQMAALFEYTIRDLANAALSFPTITAGGKNAIILHYPTPNAVINDGDLVLFDLGAKADLYCADISRTYPANGKYSSLQKTIYETVLTANKNVIAMIKPGLTLKDLQDYTIGFYQKELMRLGLIDNPEEVKDVYYHNVSHHLGIDTHDVSDRSLPLEAGNVITVEPGLYFKKYGIGVRIEDDVLVTETGSENLSKEIIKEVADIEKAIQSR